ncbi:MAG: Transposase DNA-binding [Parachlamydiales bacterium]|nr:Transposase DNA-binding [Parachlamydiales bacterium]
MQNTKTWIEKQWPSFLFFDPRHHKRAINIASAMLTKPTASLPGRFTLQKEIKGCYRFLDNKAFDHQMLQCQHYLDFVHF